MAAFEIVVWPDALTAAMTAFPVAPTEETSNNTYVYAVKFDLVITTSSTGTPTVASERKIIVRNNPPGQETWNVVPFAITIGAAPFFTFQVSSVTTSSTVKWVGNLELTVVT